MEEEIIAGKYFKKELMSNTIKIILSILLFICLADLPYGYYQFIRFAGLVGFGFLAYEAHQNGKEKEMFIFGISFN